ncbi:unnamed protein product [Cylicocyclus nassatus]|uniref:Protein kinase domain-containing protein n=1 Tax=Cylicocyclus nassatus TaxID=53992 RepID=A0AA36H392_CYLNA|nr:unnamed protein product [Cylicocyclus nassatus]
MRRGSRALLQLLDRSRKKKDPQTSERKHSKELTRGRRKTDKLKKKRRKNVKRKKSFSGEGVQGKSTLLLPEYVRECLRKSKEESTEYVEIDGILYTKGKRLGSGGSSSVWKVTKEDGNCFALKEVNLRRNAEILRGEAKRLHILRDAPHIVNLITHDLVDNGLTLRMILELGEVDLEVELKRQQGKFDASIARTFALEIAMGIKEMHDHSIIHLDIKLANILIIGGCIKIMDLGLSAILANDEDAVIRDFMFGSNRPPEQIIPRGDGTYKLTKKVDTWGFGFVVYQMNYGRRPFSDLPGKTMTAILDPNVRLQHDLEADPILTEFLEVLAFFVSRLFSLISLFWMCTIRDVKERASIEKLLAHQYLAEATPIANRGCAGKTEDIFGYRKNSMTRIKSLVAADHRTGGMRTAINSDGGTSQTTNSSSEQLS